MSSYFEIIRHVELFPPYGFKSRKSEYRQQGEFPVSYRNISLIVIGSYMTVNRENGVKSYFFGLSMKDTDRSGTSYKQNRLFP